MVDQRLPAPATGKIRRRRFYAFYAFQTIWYRFAKFYFHQSPVRSPVPAAGGRPFLPLENVNTSYHSEFQQILSINVVGEHIFKKRCQNFTFQKSFLTISTEKKNVCKSIPNGLKRVKNMKPSMPNFQLSPATSFNIFSFSLTLCRFMMVGQAPQRPNISPNRVEKKSLILCLRFRF